MYCAKLRCADEEPGRRRTHGPQRHCVTDTPAKGPSCSPCSTEASRSRSISPGLSQSIRHLLPVRQSPNWPAVAPGVVGNERAVVMLSDGVG